MFKLGQNTNSKLLKGILVSLEFFAVALMSSVTVRIRSRFSCGSWAMSDLSALTRDWDGGLKPEKFGNASVERDGGFLSIESPPRGPVGRDGPPLRPRPRMELFWL
jgi:hypothetical protein